MWRKPTVFCRVEVSDLLYTSFFDNESNIPSDYGRIAVVKPTEGWCFSTLPILYPTWDMSVRLKMSEDIQKFKEDYFDQILSRIDSKKLLTKIQEITHCDNNVLFGYDNPTAFCPRQLISKFFNENGVECKEYLTVKVVHNE